MRNTSSIRPSAVALPGSTGAETEILRAENVVVHYAIKGQKQRIHVINDVSLTLGRGEVVCLIGPSGCGKSSLLSAIAGLITPTSGEIYLAGQRVKGYSGNCALVFQQPTLLPWRTARGNVMYGLQMGKRGSSREIAEAADQALEQVGLSAFAHVYPSELSGGMQQRVNLARALALQPALYLMDEPLASLDALLRRRMQRLILHILTQQGGTCLFVTHDVSEAVAIADRIILFSSRPAAVLRTYSVPSPRSAHLRDITEPKLAELQKDLLDALEDDDSARHSSYEEDIG